VIIIAEAGVNHNGSLELAMQLVDVASEAGADYVKFQTYKAEKITSRYAAKADYQKAGSEEGESQLNMLRKLELSHEAHIKLKAYCEQKNICFLSSPFDLDSIYFLKELGIKTGKIPSGEITNLPYLRAMANSFEDLILSSGMAEMQELEDAVNILLKAGASKDRITILHCNTEYPTPFGDVNLRAMLSIQQYFAVKIGYSDHTIGIEVSVAAVALGASIIEKHFTLNKDMEGPDHKASLDPMELKQMVAAIRNIESALGSSVKTVSASEMKNKAVARKSIVAAIDIQQGELFTDNNLTIKRPGNGINPMQWDIIVGQAAKRNFSADELIEI
jgi:N,N'-diacetyllegionaminate synthase